MRPMAGSVCPVRRTATSAGSFTGGSKPAPGAEFPDTLSPTSVPQDRDSGGEAEEQHERGAHDQLSDQHRLGPLSGLASTSASSLRRNDAARASSEARIFAPSSPASASAEARSRSSSTPRSSPSRAIASHGVMPISRAFASACRILAIAQWSPMVDAVISASGRPRPPARFIATRSRKLPTTCRKSRRRASGLPQRQVGQEERERHRPASRSPGSRRARRGRASRTGTARSG